MQSLAQGDDYAAAVAGAAEVDLPFPVRAAAAVLVLEALGMITLGAVVCIKVVTGSPSSVGFALTAGVLTIGTGVVLGVLAQAVLRGRGWAFVPIIVLQGLALPVGYSLAVEAGLWQYGGPVLLLALAEICLLVTPSSRRLFGPGAGR